MTLLCPHCQKAIPKPQKALSIHQLRVANLILEGKSNREIGTLLDRSPDSVKQASSQIYKKTGVRSRSQFIAKFFAAPSKLEEAR